MNPSTPTVELSSGKKMPSIGFGTYQISPGRATFQAVADALDVGYRLIDTASFYGNEADVREAIQASGIPRDDIFITTKLWNKDHGHDKALKAFQKSLKALGSIDLYLIHWPVLEGRRESWKVLTQLYHGGQVGAIGVSNYMDWHLAELLADGDVVPMVDQVEMSPFLQQRPLREFCSRKGIVVEAYSPLARGRRFRDRRLMSVAEKHHYTPAQVMVRWCMQCGAVPIPKSTNRGRMEENFNVLDLALDEDDMTVLASCDADLHVSWDPTKVP